jgi:hypothetical protein
MATTREQLVQLQKQVRRLKIESAEMRRVLRERGLLPGNGRRNARGGKRALSENERGIEILRRAGAIREMTPEEKKIAAEWDALPEEEKREVTETLRRVRLDPPLSQLIHEMR